MGKLILSCLFALTARPNDITAATANQLPSEQQVLTFIADTIDWYRHRPTAQRIGTEPADLLFLEDNRPITTEIVRLSFEFGKAVAALDPPQSSATPESTDEPATTNAEMRYLAAARKEVDANADQAHTQLKALEQARLTARRENRKALDMQIADIQSRIQLLTAMSGNYQDLLGFVRNSSAKPNRGSNMAELVDNLARSVPDVSAAASPSQTPNLLGDPARAPYGIMGLISQVSTVAHKQRLVDLAIGRTDAITKSLDKVRLPFTEPFRKELSTLSLDTKGLDALEQEEGRLADLVAQAQTASPAIGALIKQKMLLNLYQAHLAEWRTEIEMEYRAAWKALLVRLGGLAVAIGLVVGVSVLMRRMLWRHVPDPDTRKLLLISQRVLCWLVLIGVVLFAFAFDLSSLATFLGLLSAGLAVGLHDVFLAIGGYLLMVRKFRLRVGDRVQVSGVTGEVTTIGLMQFELSEIDAATEKRTGRVVCFSNSYVFVSPATPLFRQITAAA